MSSTPIEKIPSILEGLRSSFRKHITLPLSFRKSVLRNLARMIVHYNDRILAAVREDLHQLDMLSQFNLNVLLDDIDHTLDHLDTWAAPEKRSVPLIHQFASSWVVPEPLGVVLIISPWNYPFILFLTPLIGAIAAGNCVVVKPSEVSGASAKLAAEMLADERFVDKGVIQCVTGGVPETTELLRHKFDHVFFTGATEVGRIVMQAAAKHLTPCTLELGGKSPTIVDENVDLEVAVKRILWGKVLTCGQNCISPDYIFVHKKHKDAILEKMIKYLKKFFPKGPQNDGYARIISEKHVERLVSYLDEIPKECIAYGGKIDKKDKFIEPTILVDVPQNTKMMNQEIFGPFLPIKTFEQIDEVIDYINDRPKPLALYIFSKNSTNIDRIEKETSSGAVVVNDTILHFLCPSLPFGGVGESGCGAYHGIESFKTFSHYKPILKRATWFDLPSRFPPLSPKMQKLMMRRLPGGLKRQQKQILKWILYLGVAATTFYALHLMGIIEIKGL